MTRLTGRVGLDGFVARRVHTLPEGTHMASLLAAFLADLRTSPLGGMCLSDTAMGAALERLPMDINGIKVRPLSSSTVASWLGLINNLPDLQHIETLLPMIHSFYTVSQVRPSNAGRHPNHVMWRNGNGHD